MQRPALEERHIRVGFTLSILFNVAAACLMFTQAHVVADLLKLPDLTPVVQGGSVVFLCRGFSTIAEAVAQRALRFRWLAGLDVFSFAVGFILVAPVLAWSGLGIWALVGGLVTTELTRMVALLVGQRHTKRLLLERNACKDLLYFGSGSTLANTLGYVAGQIDRLIVGRLLGAEALGIYHLSSQLTATPAAIVSQIMNRVLFPAMARVQEEPARLARAYRSSLAGCALVFLPVSLTVAIVSPELVFVLLGDGWDAAVAPLQILALAMVFRMSYGLSEALAQARGAVFGRALRQAVFACAVAAGVLVGQRWGLEGVAWGVVAAIALNFLLMTELCLRLTGMPWRELFAAHLPSLALAGVIGTSVLALTYELRELHVAPIILLLDVTALAVAEGLLLVFLLPRLFLGRDGQAVFRILGSVAPDWVRLRRSPR